MEIITFLQDYGWIITIATLGILLIILFLFRRSVDIGDEFEISFGPIGVPVRFNQNFPGLINKLRIWRMKTIHQKINSGGEVFISIWGPTNSGKTWLIMALVKQLKMYTAKSKYFKYEIWNADDSSPVELPTSPSSISSTGRRIERRYRYLRYPKTSSANYSSTYSLIILDAPGNLTTSLDESATAPDSNRLTAIDIRKADCLLVILDTFTTLAKGDPGSEYTVLIERLEQYLTTPAHEQNNDRIILVCLTKADQMGLALQNYLDTWKIVEEQFGNRVRELLEPLASHQPFLVSSFGFIDRTTPNYNPVTKFIDDFSKWQPYNVEYPFFWFIDKIERKKIKENKIRWGYIGYPKLKR